MPWYTIDLRSLSRSAQQEFPQEYPQPGWVEHDPEAIWASVVAVTRKALDDAGSGRVAGLGITNQRETTLIWDRETGRCVHRAIVWQDRRTADLCQKLKSDGQEQIVIDKTGLRLDPYFSATQDCVDSRSCGGGTGVG